MSARLELRGVLVAGVALGAATFATAAAASPGEDARDVRLAKLEAAVAALQGQVARDEALQQENTELKGEVHDLQAQVADLEATTDIRIDDVRQAAAAQPKISLAGGKPTFSTADGQFTASLRGELQLDTAGYFQSPAGPAATDLRRDGPALGASASSADSAHARDLKDGTLWRRARIGIDGTAYGDFDYRILFDFGGSGVEDAGQLYEGWVQYSGLRPFHFRVGAFPVPIGLEDQSSNYTLMLLERPASSDVVRGLMAGDARMGAGVWGDGAWGGGHDWFVSADVTGRPIGVVNTGTVITSTPGAVATPQTFGDQLALVGRFNFTPLRGSDWRVNLGAHGGYVDLPANASGPAANGVTPISSFQVSLSDTPELRVDGTQFINTGKIDARNASDVGGEFAAQWNTLFLQGEYEAFHVGRSDGITSPSFSGWYVEGSWSPSGDARAYNPSTAAFDWPAVKHPFSLKGGRWGAWELALRYSETNLDFDAGAPGSAPAADAIRGGDQRIFAAGINWYLNPVFRMMLDVDEVRIDRLSPNASVYATPTGAQIGQTFTAVAVRTEAAF